jgi:hypothetical protein
MVFGEFKCLKWLGITPAQLTRTWGFPAIEAINQFKRAFSELTAGVI